MISFNTGAVAAAIPLISSDFGLSDLLVSKIVPFYMIPYGLGALLYAPLSRVLSYRKILIGIASCYALFSLMSGLSQSLDTILLAQIGAGVAAGGSTPLSLMIIGELFDKNIRGRMVGLFFGTSFFASTIGMFFMGIVSWHLLFFIPAVLGMVTALGLLTLKTNLIDKAHNESINYLKAFSRPDIRRVFVFIFAMSFLYHALQKWYGVYLSREYGLNKETISAFLILASLCGLSGQQIGGFLSDKKGRLTACYVGIFILAMGAMSLVGHYPIVLVPVILGVISIGWTINHNSVSTILTDFPDENRPVIACLNSSVRFFSGGLGFALSKFFVEKSFPLTFLGIGSLMFLMAFSIKHVMPKDV